MAILQSTTLKVKDLILSSEVYSTDKVKEFIDGVYAIKHEANSQGFITERKALSPLSVITATEDAYSKISDE